jgi:hypothetical protein
MFLPLTIIIFFIAYTKGTAAVIYNKILIPASSETFLVRILEPDYYVVSSHCDYQKTSIKLDTTALLLTPLSTQKLDGLRKHRTSSYLLFAS